MADKQRDVTRLNYWPAEDLQPGDVGFYYHHPYEVDPTEGQVVPMVCGSLKDRLTALNVFASDGNFISTTTGDLQAQPRQKFQINEAGNLLLPPDPADGVWELVADFNQKRLSQDNFVIATGDGETIAAGQIKDKTKRINAINLRHIAGLENFELFQFVYYKQDKNWGILFDGIFKRFGVTTTTNIPYIFTTAGDLQIAAYQRVAIKEPGNILLWSPLQIGEYAKIVDDLGLLPTQNNYLIAPDGHLIIGKNVSIEKAKQSILLSNIRGASQFEIKYAGSRIWQLGFETNYG